jgi:hypothetical protein
METGPRYETVMRILETLPETMALGDALTEAQRIKRETETLAQRAREEAYRKTHREERNRQSRECKARKKEKLQAEAAMKNSMVAR